MNKTPVTLPHAIKIVVSKNGKDVVRDVRLLNIMNDMVYIEDSAAVKNILREVLKSGYGSKLLSLTPPHDDYQLKIKAYSKTISDSLGFKDVIVQYILYSIAYGIGLCPSIPRLKNTTTLSKGNKKEKEIKKEEKKVVEKIVTEKKGSSFVKIAAFWAVIIFGVFFGYNYFDSSEERENFRQSLFSGDKFLNSGDYANAVESYKAAYNGYNSFNRNSYKSDALEKIDALTDRLIKEGDNKSLNQAYNTVVSELQLDLSNSDKERLESKRTELETTIGERINNGRNTLITNISANNGKLDDNGKKLLGELLELSPNDYWLNFIKGKSNE